MAGRSNRVVGGGGRLGLHLTASLTRPAAAIVAAAFVASTLAVPIVDPSPASAETLPTATVTVSDAALASIYSALRPANLRGYAGPRTFGRGAEIALAYEMVNGSASAVTVPQTTLPSGPVGSWFGVTQGWIARTPVDASDRSLDACLPGAGRDGAWYAIGGEVASTPLGTTSIQPAAGFTRMAWIPGSTTACLPAGGYLVRIDYRRIDAAIGSAPIATVTTNIALRDARAWRATVTGGRPSTGLAISLTAVATATPDSSTSTAADLSTATGLVARYSVSGLDAGAAATVTAWAGGCGSGSTFQVGQAIPVVAATDGTASGAATLALTAEVRTALVERSLIGVRLDSGWIACGLASPVLAAATNRAPTTYGGGLLVDRLPGGLRVVASSETSDGRPAQAVDGLSDRTWNAGRYGPSWIELDLAAARTLTGVLLLPSQLPNVALTTHLVWGRAAGSVTERLLATVSRTTTDNAWVRVTFARPAYVRYLRIESIRSPSWIAWREIRPIAVGWQVPLPSRLPFGTHDGSTYAVARGAQCYANGWAWDPDSRTGRVTVRILVDGREVWRGPANQARPDVAKAGFGDGYSGFWVTLTTLVTKNVAHSVRTQARDLTTDRWVDLNLTPRPLLCIG